MCACIVTLGHLRRAGRAGLEDNTTAVRGVRCEIYEAEKSWARWIPSVGGARASILPVLRTVAGRQKALAGRDAVFWGKVD